MPNFERAMVTKLEKRLREEDLLIQMIVGPRQTGKTTAIKQTIEKIPTPVHYVSADGAGLKSGEWLEREWEHARLLNTQSKRGALLVVDEIQKVTDWSDIAKMLWDQDRWNNSTLKVVLTGSSSLLLSEGMTESLMGRYEVLHSPHWSLAECQAAFDYSLEEFLFYGGYPGSSRYRDDYERWADYLVNSIIEPTISRDVLQLKQIRKPALLRALFYLGATYSGQELTYDKMLGQLKEKGNATTLANYLELLTKANMLTGMQKYSGQMIQQRRSSPRLMVYDTSLMTSAAELTPRQLKEDTTYRGRIVESAVGAYLLARGQEERYEVFWWRERGDEVDFIIKKGERLTAIEVKSGRIKNTEGSLVFMKQHPEALSYVVGSTSTPLDRFLRGEYPLFKE